MSQRIEKVNSLLEKIISQLLQKEIIFPDNVMVTLTHVDAASNLFEAKAYVSVYPEDRTADVVEILRRETYDLQRELNIHLKMRPVPKIIFVADKESVKAGAIETILAKLKKEEK